jgi:hypothetical protein
MPLEVLGEAVAHRRERRIAFPLQLHEGGVSRDGRHAFCWCNVAYDRTFHQQNAGVGLR